MTKKLKGIKTKTGENIKYEPILSQLVLISFSGAYHLTMGSEIWPCDN